MDKFFEYSRLLGLDPALAQGAGGNSSYKKDGLCIVKASGVFLKNISPSSGFVTFRLEPVVKYLQTLEQYATELERPFNELVVQSVVAEKSFGQPSIEAGLHAVLPCPYVFHTHSVYANVFNCMSSGEKILKKIFSDQTISCISYQNPGLELALALKTDQGSSMLFLKNHGLITQSQSLKEAYQLTILVNQRLRDYIQQQGGNTDISVRSVTMDTARHLFPDSVVYSQLDLQNLNPSQRAAFEETASAVNFIERNISRLHGQPIYLPEGRVRFLQDMEQEKYRLAQLNKHD